jgi:hypothetical protein
MTVMSIVRRSEVVKARGFRRTKRSTGCGTVENLSAPGKIRTCDLSLRRRALYPLSYGRGMPSLGPAGISRGIT